MPIHRLHVWTRHLLQSPKAWQGLDIADAGSKCVPVIQLHDDDTLVVPHAVGACSMVSAPSLLFWRNWRPPQYSMPAKVPIAVFSAHSLSSAGISGTYETQPHQY